MNQILRFLLLCLLFLICETSPLIGENDTLKAYHLYYDGKDLYYAGQYAKAKETYLQSMAIYKKLYGESHKWIMKLTYQLGRTERLAINYASSLKYLRQSLDIAEELYGYESEDVGYTLQAIGNTYDNMFDPDKSREYYLESIEVFKKVYGTPSLEVGGAYMNMGLSDLDRGDYQQADQNFQTALAIFKESSEPNGKAFNKIYINMSYLYNQVGEYDKAISFGEKALEVKLMNYDELHPSVAKYFGHLGKLHQHKEDYEKALPYLQKNLDLSIRSVGKEHPDTGSCFSDLGALYMAMGDFEKGLEQYEKAVQVFEAHADPTNPMLINLYKNMGEAYGLGLKEYDKGLSIFQQAIDKAMKRSYRHGRSLSVLKRGQANILREQGSIEEALTKLQDALAFLVPAFRPSQEDIYSNPDIGGTQERLELLKNLTMKSKLLEERHRQSNELEDMEQALRSSMLALDVIEKMRRSYLSSSSREYLNKRTNPIYEKAFHQAFDLYRLTKETEYIRQAFMISEKGKASILWQNVNERYAFEASGISRTELDSIHYLHQRIAVLEERRQNIGDDASVGNRLDKQIFELTMSYEDRIKKLEEENQQYFQLKYTQGSNSIASLQDHISDQQTALLSYFYTEEALFIFLITKEEFQAFRQELEMDLDQSILALRDQHVTLDLQKADVRNLLDQMNDLHTLLVEPIQEGIADMETLVVIPHGILQLLPFEMLVTHTQGDDFRKAKYLLKDYNIHYAWSAALWADVPDRERRNDITYTGFAPSFGAEEGKAIASSRSFVFRDGFSPLTHSIEEVKAANKYFAGETFTREDASKSKFLDIAPKSKIIHLATHAVADDRFPTASGLLFSADEPGAEEGFLKASEIYNLNLSADLAVMSACNTGYGQLVKGEGVMSLGRAFLHAGCKSVLTSLWLANDQSTSLIMQNFYKYAADGMTKDEALRKAKLDYLRQADALTAHPYFWANLVVVGDMSPLQQKRNVWIWLLGVASALLVAFLLWSRFRS